MVPDVLQQMTALGIASEMTMCSRLEFKNENVPAPCFITEGNQPYTPSNCLFPPADNEMNTL